MVVEAVEGNKTPPSWLFVVEAVEPNKTPPFLQIQFCDTFANVMMMMMIMMLQLLLALESLK